MKSELELLLEVRSPRLVALLQRAGCRQRGTTRLGLALFADTGTVRRHIHEYARDPHAHHASGSRAQACRERGRKIREAREARGAE